MFAMVSQLPGKKYITITIHSTMMGMTFVKLIQDFIS